MIGGMEYDRGIEIDDCGRLGYWCVACGRFLPEDDQGLVVHDPIPHPAAYRHAPIGLAGEQWAN